MAINKANVRGTEHDIHDCRIPDANADFNAIEKSIERIMFSLDTSASSGTDKEIYDALVALGWQDCIEN